MDGKDDTEGQRFLNQEEAAELLALLERSAAEHEGEGDFVEGQLDKIFDDNFKSDEVHFISGWQDLPPASSLTTVAPPPRRRVGAFILAVALVTSIGVLAFGAMSWLKRCEPVRTDQIAIDESGINRLREQERELNALRRSHLKTIAALEARIAALDAEGAPGSGEQISELAAALAEMKAEAHALEIAAELLDKRKSASGRSSHAASEEPAATALAEPPAEPAEADDSLVEDNPYGNVSLASVLEGAVREEAFETGSAKADKTPNGKIESLIESAVKGPNEDAAGKQADEVVNTLPDDGVELPMTPTRKSVRKVLGSMTSAVKRCGGEPYQRLVVEVTVVGATGRVVKAKTIDANHAGTPVGACAAKAVKLARFPKFQKDKVVIKFPFDL